MLMLILITACKPGADKIKDGNNTDFTVTVSMRSEPSSLHITNNTGNGPLVIFDYTQRTLTRIDMRNLKQIPLMVTDLGIIAADKKSIKYTLKSGIKWDDGNPLTANDVAFTMKVTMAWATANPVRKVNYENVSEVVLDSTDKSSFTVQFKSASYLNKHIFNELAIMQQSVWDSENILGKYSITQLSNEGAYAGIKEATLPAWFANYNKGENGTNLAKLGGLGPYIVTRWEAGAFVELTKKKTWWGSGDTSFYARANPNRIIIRYIVDDVALMTEIANKKIDVIGEIGTANFNKLKTASGADSQYYFLMGEQFNYNTLAMRTKEWNKQPAIFSDINLREAMMLLTDVDAINKSLAEGSGTRLNSFVLPFQSPYYNNDLPLYKYDLEAAKALLEISGWKLNKEGIRTKKIAGKEKLLDVTFVYLGNASTQNLAIILKEVYKAAGINLILKDGGKAMPMLVANREYDLALFQLSNSAILEDPAQLFDFENYLNGGYNLTGFNNPKAYELIKKIQVTDDVNEQANYTRELQKLVYDSKEWIYLYAVKRKIIISKKFTNAHIYIDRPGIWLGELTLNN